MKEFLLVLLLAAAAQPATAKILGARMSWEVNPLFEGDDVTSVRKVTLKLTTAWETVGVCTAVVGSPVSGASCVVAQNFGQLCWYNCRDVAAMSCDPVQCTNNLLVRDQPPGVDAELFSQPYFQGTLTHTVDVPQNRDMLIAFLKWADPSGDKFEQKSGARSAYWDGFDPSSIALFAAENSPIVPTFVPLCTGAPETDGSVATCRLGLLENYFSPTPMFPLIVAGPSDITMQAPSYIKVADLDGHKLIMEKTRSYTAGAWSDDPRENTGSTFYDVDPAGATNGPRVFFKSPTSAQYTEKWFEVADRTYDRLEPTTLESSFKTFSKWTDRQASVQLLSSVLPVTTKCSTSNPPPFFTASATSTAALSATHLTEYSCEWTAGFPGSKDCAVPLFARTIRCGCGRRLGSRRWTRRAGTRSARPAACRAAAARRTRSSARTCRGWCRGTPPPSTQPCWVTPGPRTISESFL